MVRMNNEMFWEILINMHDSNSLFDPETMTFEEIESVMYTWKYGLK